jgi:hypothetical protein
VTGQDFNSHGVQFDCDIIPPHVPEGTLVVTINPYVPARCDSDSDEPVGSFSTVTLDHLLGDEILTYFVVEREAQSAVEEYWPRGRRLFEYYLAENWANSDRAGRESFKDWPETITGQGLSTIPNQALRRFGTLVNGELSDPAVQFMGSYLRSYSAAIDRFRYKERPRSDRDFGTLVALQRSIFVLMGLFVGRFEMWKTGRLPRWIEEPWLLDDLTLFRDEFPEMPDLYQQAFEVVCKTLRYPIAVQNTVKRYNPDDFGDDNPDIAKVPLDKRPSNLNQFERLANAHTVACVALVPRWVGVAASLKSEASNTIVHATARFDLRTGRIVSAADSTGLSYLEFVAKVFDMFEPLYLALQIVRTARVTSSLDFQNADRRRTRTAELT